MQPCSHVGDTGDATKSLFEAKELKSHDTDAPVKDYTSNFNHFVVLIGRNKIHGSLRSLK